MKMEQSYRVKFKIQFNKEKLSFDTHFFSYFSFTTLFHDKILI